MPCTLHSACLHQESGGWPGMVRTCDGLSTWMLGSISEASPLTIAKCLRAQSQPVQSWRDLLAACSKLHPKSCT